MRKRRPPTPNGVTFRAEIAAIDLGKGLVALLDEEDYWLAQPYRWKPAPGGRTRYAVTKDPWGRTSSLHRLILRPKASQEVDHINGDGLDNRRINLRLCSHQQNSCNMKPIEGTTSPYKGVAWVNNRWRVKVKQEG